MLIDPAGIRDRVFRALWACARSARFWRYGCVSGVSQLLRDVADIQAAPSLQSLCRSAIDTERLRDRGLHARGLGIQGAVEGTDESGVVLSTISVHPHVLKARPDAVVALSLADCCQVLQNPEGE